MNNEYNVKPYLWDFAELTIKKYNIDKSHGMRHYINTMLYAKIILRDYMHVNIIEGLSKAEEEDLILDASFVHDLIDKKYIKDEENTQTLVNVFVANGYSANKVRIIIEIINSISFSKRISRKKEGLSMIPDGPLKLAMCIVTDADQLEGYDIDRCITYQETKYSEQHSIGPTERSALILGWSNTILRNRVLKYITEYMNTDIAKLIAAPLHGRVLDFVNTKLATADLYEYP